jgi:hypothetical protein
VDTGPWGVGWEAGAVAATGALEEKEDTSGAQAESRKAKIRAKDVRRRREKDRRSIDRREIDRG